MAKAKQDVRIAPEDIRESFVKLIAADRIKNLAEKRKESEEGVVKPELLRMFAEHVWEKHAKPKHNPRYAVADERGRLDTSAIFQVQTRFSFQLSERENQDNLSIEFRLASDLVDYAGLSQEKATLFVENELHTYPGVPVNIHELIYGKYVEGEWEDANDIAKSAGQKLLGYIMAEAGEELPEPLTDGERDAVKEYEKEMYRLRPGLFERIHLYVDNAEQLYGVLKVLNPTHFCSHCKLGESDTPEDRVTRYADEAVKLVKTSRIA